MSRFKPFILGAMAGAAVVYTSLQYHVVHSNDGFYICLLYTSDAADE